MKLNKSLTYMLILTVVAAFLAYKIVVKAYSGVFDPSGYEAQIVESK